MFGAEIFFSNFLKVVRNHLKCEKKLKKIIFSLYSLHEDFCPDPDLQKNMRI